LLRLVFIKKLKVSRVFIPDQLKLLVKATRADYLLKEKKIHYFKSNKNYIFENVNYLSHIDTRFYNSIFKKFAEKYKKFLRKSNYIQNNKFKYILISRDHSNRKLLNENELFKLLRPLGFLKISFENLSLKKQIEISQNAEIIVGYHGAGLSNCFFMKKNKNFIEIVNKHYNHPFYKIYTQILELNYKKFLCLKNYRNLNGICDAEKITKYISTLI
jgi:capsular polysaccharide biosynthesis protein